MKASYRFIARMVDKNSFILVQKFLISHSIRWSYYRRIFKLTSSLMITSRYWLTWYKATKKSLKYFWINKKHQKSKTKRRRKKSREKQGQMFNIKLFCLKWPPNFWSNAWYLAKIAWKRSFANTLIYTKKIKVILMRLMKATTYSSKKHYRSYFPKFNLN